jgi:NAD(P)-dependent dehydrogenase (short-subunit alcohol dehydrogenase family)
MAGSTMGSIRKLKNSMVSILDQLRSTEPPSPAAAPFIGHTILITGATSGLGLEAATIFTRDGAASVIITTRNAKKGDEAKAKIEQRTGKTNIVTVRVLGMDSLDSVEKFMVDLRNDVGRMDSVILNAAVHNTDYKQLPSGWEANLQVNVLSTTLLGMRMAQWMKDIKREGQKQHLVIVNCASHLHVDIENGFPTKDVLQSWNNEQNFVFPEASYEVSQFFQMCGAQGIAGIIDGASPGR